MSKKSPTTTKKLEPYQLYENSPNKDKILLRNTFADILFYAPLNKIISQPDLDKFSYNQMYKVPGSVCYKECSQQIEEQIRINWNLNSEIEKDGKKDLEFTQLAQLTDRKHFNQFFWFHFTYFFVQIPIPIVMEKMLDWFGKDILTMEDDQSRNSFILKGIFYSTAMALLYLVKCIAETSQRYSIAAMKTKSSALGQTYIANRVSSLIPGASKYFDIGKITSMLKEDCDTVAGNTYLRANRIVSNLVLNFLTFKDLPNVSCNLHQRPILQFEIHWAHGTCHDPWNDIGLEQNCQAHWSVSKEEVYYSE